jgi:hypothetical protein
MTHRPLLAAAALCATLTLAACNGSPKAGQPNTTPVSPVTTASTTPSQSDEEDKAIAAAKSRYMIARGAVATALRAPDKATRAALENAGNGGDWIIAVIGRLTFQKENGWYQSGTVKYLSTDLQSVNLTAEQPEVRLINCIDSSGLVDRYKSNGKPVPHESSDGDRHKFQSKLVFAPASGTSKKMWFLVEEKVTGPC